MFIRFLKYNYKNNIGLLIPRASFLYEPTILKYKIHYKVTSE